MAYYNTEWSFSRPPIHDYADKVQNKAQQAINQTKFKKYEITLYIEKGFGAGTPIGIFFGYSYVVKVDTGNGDDKFAHVQFFVPQVGEVEFTAAKIAKKSDPLEQLEADNINA